MSNLCIDWITRWGSDAIISPNTMSVVAPRRDTPAAVQMQFSDQRNSQKNALPSETQNKVAARPHQEKNIINKFLVTDLTHMKQR
jgi:hypothetical protein